MQWLRDIGCSTTVMAIMLLPTALWAYGVWHAAAVGRWLLFAVSLFLPPVGAVVGLFSIFS